MQQETIALLPLGAYEQHGFHLPFATDSIIACGFIEEIKKLSLPLSIAYLPCQTIGYSPEHLWDKRSKSLPYQEAIEGWIAIGKNCLDKNIHKLVLFNAHGGNAPLMAIAAQEIRSRYNMLCVTTAWTRFDLPEEIITAQERQQDIHAGFLETSLMLALAPDQVRLDKAENFSNQQENFIQKYHYLRAYGKHSFGWHMNDLNPKGACGCAQKASAETGRKILHIISQQLAQLLLEIADYNIPWRGA